MNRKIFFLLKGSVSVYSKGNFVNRYGRSGDIFGEMSVVSEPPASATVITNEFVEVLVVDGTIMGGFQSSLDHEWVTVFYKLFTLSLLEKLKLTTLKARLYEKAVRHQTLDAHSSHNELFNKNLEKRLSETLLTSMAIHTAELAIIVTDIDGRIVRFNLAAENLFSMIELQIVGQPIQSLSDQKGGSKIIPLVLRGDIPSWSGDLMFLRGDRRTFPARTSLSAILDEEGAIIGLLAILTDISREKLLEEQLIQSQKKEAIGQLAGSVSHDFNNLLQIISGHLELATLHLESPEKVRKELEAIQKGIQRGSSLTTNLLSFSRKTSTDKKPISLNDVLVTMEPMVRMIIDSHIQLEILPEASLWTVEADFHHMEQVLANLCLNARDAMPKGGRLSLKTENATLSAAFCADHIWAKPGRFAMVSVSDNGEGMSSEVGRQVFEPFFTTKGPGKGTGLGLSIVRRILHDHKGLLHLESEEGKGSTFRLYLPSIQENS